MSRVMRFLSVRRIALVAVAMVLAAAVGNALPKKSQRLVNDYCNLLPAQEREAMERMLVAFDDSTSNQIAVIFTEDLEGYDIASYAIETAESWSVGREGVDNGVLVVVKPKTSSQKGEAFIAVGYGLEGAIPDVVAKRIVYEYMIPYFKKDDYYAGTMAALDILMKLASGEITVSSEKEGRGMPLGVVFLIFIIILFFVSLIGGGGGGSDTYTHSGHRRSHGGPIIFGGFGGSGGGFSGGGGFGGFGGGSFGGGGAGGSW